ncbi:MAG: pyridoxal-phosphate dependent enzyme [Candidatus Coatesbacteria bacterium]|nr:pyridoxal-phosphate dependent enzyme [Candidatus Coatesbacteria bacterium]
MLGVGDTPLIRLERLFTRGRVYAKLEGANPGGSVKDRVALALILDGQRRGYLSEGGTVVEASSGNTGIGLARVGRELGCRVVVIMPAGHSPERRELIESYGARVIETPAVEGMAGALGRARELAAERDWWLPGQFTNPAVIEAHRRTTAGELLDQLPEVPAALVLGVGTAGTLTGLTLGLRTRWPELRAYAVEPAASAVLSGGPPGRHRLEGLGSGLIPPFYHPELVDEVLAIEDEAALELTRELYTVEGILAGPSSGAVLAACRRLLSRGESGPLLTLLPDHGRRYLSTGIFDGLEISPADG